jgi:hypothetical protein
VTTARPGARASTTPFAETVAVAGALEEKTTFLFVAFAGETDHAS